MLIFVLVSWLSCCTVLIVICRLSLLTAINIHHLDYRYDYTIYTFKCLLQTDNSMTGSAYIREVLIQNLAEIHEEMSELLDKQVNV